MKISIKSRVLGLYDFVRDQLSADGRAFRRLVREKKQLERQLAAVLSPDERLYLEMDLAKRTHHVGPNLRRGMNSARRRADEAAQQGAVPPRAGPRGNRKRIEPKIGQGDDHA